MYGQIKHIEIKGIRAQGAEERNRSQSWASMQTKIEENRLIKSIAERRE
jgi:hypothetical protein